MSISKFKVAYLLLLLSLIASCSGIQIKREFPKTRQELQDEKIGKITGDGIVFGKSSGSEVNSFLSSSPTISVNVNPYLWRASLDYLNFMPLNSTDSMGGVIVTDWYSLDNNAKKKYKINVYILSKELSSNSIKVTIYKQSLNKDLIWSDQHPDQNLAAKIKDKIIERARELKANNDIIK